MSGKNGKGELLGAAAFLAGSYAYGSLPFVRSLGLWRGVDLRKTGSGAVGGSNLWQQAGPAAGAIGWFLDASKGALPPVVGRRLGLSRVVCALGATAGVAGQCWPVFSGFDGGRGVSPILGAGSTLAPRDLAFILPPMVAGCSLRVLPLIKGSGDWTRLRGGRSKAVPLSVGLGVLGIPLLAALRGRSSEVVLATVANAALLFIRRVSAGSASVGEEEAGWTFFYRLLYDRDTAE